VEERKKPFWKTIPGILTQIAGVVTALAAIGGAFTQLGLLGGGDTGTNAKQAGLVGGAQPQGPGQPQIEWARKANRICTGTIKSYRGLPRMASLRLLQKQVDIGWYKVGRIRDLAPPQGEKTTYRKYISAIAVQMESLEQRVQLVKSAIRAGNGADETFKREHDALLTRIHEQNRRSDTLAVELGATVCAQEPY
jgi:hypothetical protein